MIRVLVVDDSSFMRKAVTHMLASDSSIEVIDTASEGEEAIRKVKKLHPDVLLLDIAMPVMDGLTALAHIMAEHPTPVVVLSGIKDAKVAIKSLECGAVDFIKKPSGVISYDIDKIKDEIIWKVKVAAGVDVRRLQIFTTQPPAAGTTPFDMSVNKLSFPLVGNLSYSPLEKGDKGVVKERLRTSRSDTQRNLSNDYFDNLKEKAGKEIIIIGASTGGPRAVVNVLSGIPKSIPAGILIIQHMAPEFVPSFVERLQCVSMLDISIAAEGDIVSPGRVLVSDGGQNTTIIKDKNSRIIHISTKPSSHGILPSVDFAMESAADLYKEKTLGVLLTGMGDDGADGMKAIKKAGGATIAEDESTCVVFGMPKAAINAGVVDDVVPLPKIAEMIMRKL